jgi:oxygen-dependent protoporphyrinogen oxidase
MPQYVVGHEARIARLMDSLKPHAGLFLTGNYMDGVGVPDAVRNAKAVAKQIEASGV